MLNSLSYMDFCEIHYHPFGMVMPGREWEAGSDGEYRFGFIGKESDPETYGEGNVYDYGFRIYNPRLGRFLSVDPLTKDYAYLSPYQFAGNMPINSVDLDGRETYNYMFLYNNGKTVLVFMNKEDYKYLEWTPTLTNWTHKTLHINEEQFYVVHTGIYNDFYLETAYGQIHYQEEITFSYRSKEEFEAEASKLTPAKIEQKYKNQKIASRINQGLQNVAIEYQFDRPGKSHNSVYRSSTESQENRPGNFKYHVEGGSIKFDNNMSAKGVFDIIITESGEMFIGDGHYKMSGEATKVFAAGVITLNEKGEVMMYTNYSGHYKSDRNGLYNLEDGLDAAGLLNAKTIGIQYGSDSR